MSSRHTASHLTAYGACLYAIDIYLREQTAKGLVFEPSGPSQDIFQVGYETHWGAHQEVILPEINRLAAQYNFDVSVDVRWKTHKGWSEGRTPLEHLQVFLTKTSYVWVALNVFDPVAVKMLNATLGV